MKTLLRLLFLMVFSYSTTTIAFDEEKCSALFPKSGDAHRPYMSPVYSFTLIPSTTSYVSSFGGCAMYGSLPNSEKRNLFIAKTYEEISQQAALGSGEYLVALADLSGCEIDLSQRFSQAMKDNYTHVFRNASTRDAKDMAYQLDTLIVNDLCKSTY